LILSVIYDCKISRQQAGMWSGEWCQGHEKQPLTGSWYTGAWGCSRESPRPKSHRHIRKTYVLNYNYKACGYVRPFQYRTQAM